MNKTLITLLVVGLVSVSYAGKIKLANEPALKVSAGIKQDADASINYAQIRSDLADVGTALDAVETAIDAIDMSTIDPAAFTGAQKTCVQNLKGNLNSLKVATKSLKVAAKNNMQASMKLVKKMKETERIQKEASN